MAFGLEVLLLVFLLNVLKIYKIKKGADFVNEKEISIIMKMYDELYEFEKYEKQTLMQIK